MRLKAHIQAAAAAVVLGILPALASAQDSVDAVWVPRHVSFVYQGFTTHYSCDGLRDTIRQMLTKLAAQDLKIREFGCTRLGVEPFPGVRVTMRVLAPASSAHDHEAGPVISAHWRNVVLMPSNTSPRDQGNCELIEQFKETFLPLFTTRHIDYQSNCIPHQLTLGTHLAAEVLIPDAKPGAGR
jgi:hypothetical protein